MWDRKKWKMGFFSVKKYYSTEEDKKLNNLLKEMEEASKNNDGNSEESIKHFLTKSVRERKLNASIISKLFDNVKINSSPINFKVEPTLISGNLFAKIPSKSSFLDTLLLFILFGSIAYFTFNISHNTTIAKTTG